MDVFKIIFWICFIESIIGHLSWWVTACSLLTYIVVGLLVNNEKRKKQDKVDRALKDFKRRSK